MKRYCFKCGALIEECMGFVHAGDFLLATAGLLKPTNVRERCGKCVLRESKEEIIATLAQ
jgi:hypothetical protein